MQTIGKPTLPALWLTATLISPAKAATSASITSQPAARSGGQIRRRRSARELWAELIYKHEYAPELIDFEVNVPRRTPNDYADLVIYSDDEKKMPYFVIECKRADISDAEFNQAIEQACGNGASLGANYCGAVDGIRRRLLRFDKYPRGERERNHITDFPVRYGNPPPWRFYKNEPGKDLTAVPREELRAAIRKCHQTLWEGGRRSPIAAFGEFSKLVFIKQPGREGPGPLHRRTLRLPASGRRDRRAAGRPR